MATEAEIALLRQALMPAGRNPWELQAQAEAESAAQQGYVQTPQGWMPAWMARYGLSQPIVPAGKSVKPDQGMKVQNEVEYDDRGNIITKKTTQSYQSPMLPGQPSGTTKKGTAYALVDGEGAVASQGTINISPQRMGYQEFSGRQGAIPRVRFVEPQVAESAPAPPWTASAFSPQPAGGQFSDVSANLVPLGSAPAVPTMPPQPPQPAGPAAAVVPISDWLAWLNRTQGFRGYSPYR